MPPCSFVVCSSFAPPPGLRTPTVLVLSPNQYECKLPYINEWGNEKPGIYTFCLPGRNCTQCYIDRADSNNLMRNLDAQLAKSPWFKRSGGQDHVIVMSHWLHAARWKTVPSNLKRCSAIAFEDKNMHRLTVSYSRSCQQQRASFTFAKGQPIMLPSLYVNPHTPCNTTGNQTDFFFAGAFINPGDLHFTGCVLCQRQHTCVTSNFY